MATKNDVTGDELKTGVSTEKYREGWDRIFRKPEPTPPKPAPKPLNESLDPLDLVPASKPVITKK